VNEMLFVAVKGLDHTIGEKEGGFVGLRFGQLVVVNGRVQNFGQTSF
jgi:hypothetical protein